MPEEELPTPAHFARMHLKTRAERIAEVLGGHWPDAVLTEGPWTVLSDFYAWREYVRGYWVVDPRLEWDLGYRVAVWADMENRQREWVFRTAVTWPKNAKRSAKR